MGKWAIMKTTIEIPDALFRQVKAAAALRAESLRDFVTAALRAYMEGKGGEAPRERGWRSVFGLARPEEVAEVDRIVAEELEQIDLDAWR
jgi:Arc/MetJ family transcription regulator